jgi:hypothetical protein
MTQVDAATRPPVRGTIGRHPALVSAAAGFLAAVGLWFRLPPTAWDTLWAEDGRVFLAGAEQHGPLGALFMPYAGYLHVVPRLIAGVVVWAVPVPAWAYAMTAASCLVAGGVAVLVFHTSAGVVGTPLLRALLAAVTVLLPLGPRDVLGNPTNLHSVLMWAMFWLLLTRPSRRRMAVLLSAIGLFAALTEIQVVFLVPLMVLATRRRLGRVLVIGPVVGTVAQLVATIASPRSPVHHAADSVGSVGLGYLINAVLPNVVSLRAVGPVVAHGGWMLGCTVLALVALLAVAAVPRARPRARVAVIAAAVLSPVVYAASVLVNPTAYADYAALSHAQLDHAWLTRYGVVPGMLLLAVVVVAADVLWIDSAHESRAGATRAVAIVAAVAVAACLSFGYTPSTTRRSDGPRWSPQISATISRCATSGTDTVLELHETLGWRVPLTCRFVPRERRAPRRS